VLPTAQLTGSTGIIIGTKFPLKGGVGGIVVGGIVVGGCVVVAGMVIVDGVGGFVVGFIVVVGVGAFVGGGFVGGGVEGVGDCGGLVFVAFSFASSFWCGVWHCGVAP